MMAGAILTQTERELAAMNDASPMALKAARGQLKETRAQIADLRIKMARMQESIDTLQSQRDTAEAQIKRLLDLQERTQAQRDAAQAELNRALVVVNAARSASPQTRKQMIHELDNANYMVITEYVNCIDFALERYEAAK